VDRRHGDALLVGRGGDRASQLFTKGESANVKKPTAPSNEIQIVASTTGLIDFCVLGKTPLIFNSMSAKAQRELLLPRGRKTAADKAASLKHDPIAEFRASVYADPSDQATTYLRMKSTAFKSCIGGAALDTPGAKKAQIERLTWVEGEWVSIFGVPKMFMSVVRNAGMDKTPDIRTRAIVPEWAARVTVSFVKPMLREAAVAQLLATGGIIQGIGDWRNEKGSGTYGQFTLVSPNESEFKKRIERGRVPQVAAMGDPEMYDNDTAELFNWYEREVVARGYPRQLRGQ
jgi:hypothetical protein